MSPGASIYAHSAEAPEGSEAGWIGNIKQSLQRGLFIYKLNGWLIQILKPATWQKKPQLINPQSLIDFPNWGEISSFEGHCCCSFECIAIKKRL